MCGRHRKRLESERSQLLLHIRQRDVSFDCERTHQILKALNLLLCSINQLLRVRMVERRSGVMRIDFPNQQSWPKFSQYIREDFPNLTFNTPIKLALKKWGKLSDSDIFNNLS
jgi:hypothetical protein